MSEKPTKYYVPESSPWPLVGSVGLFVTAVGAGNFIQQSTGAYENSTMLPISGGITLAIGVCIMIYMLTSWWAETVKESLAGMNSSQLDVSYRMGMIWFIFSEVMFFGAFFGALFYTRILTIPWLSGEGAGAMTHEVLWPDFQAIWPLVTPPVPLEETPKLMSPWGLPLLNTALLITSGIFLTIAHHALIAGQRTKLNINLAISILLGVIFMFVQGYEYYHAYNDMNLQLDSGIYGSLFFFLTGFHGAHVTIGATMLLVMLIRSLRGHFTADNHFAFEASAWYWHFVDVVWIFLFFVVYWL